MARAGRRLLRTATLIAVTTATAQAVGVGDPAPRCEPLAASGTSSAARVVLIDFWASWCPPCKQAMPFLNALRNEYSDRGFEVVAINVDEDTAAARGFLAQRPVDYPVVFDPAGECAAAFAVPGMPSSYLVGRDGRVRLVHTGFRDSDAPSLREQVRAAVAEAP